MSATQLACLLMIASVGAMAVDKAEQKGNSMIAKVIEMLGEEKDKISADIAAETKTMAEYTQWCDDTMTEKSYAIKSANAKIADLNAVITESTAQLASLDDDIASLGAEIADRKSEMEKAEAIREKDHAEYVKAEAEQAEMVEKIEALMVDLKEQMNAIAVTPAPVMEGEGEEAPAGLVQVGTRHAHFDVAKMKRVMSLAVNSIWVDPESKKSLALLKKDGAFLQQPEAVATRSLDEANEEKSEDLEQFEGLKGKAEEALQRLRDEEVKKQNEHDVQMMTLKQQLALCENDLDDSKREHARISQEKSEAEEELVETEATKAADEKTLKSTTEECTAAAEAWATRQSEAKAEQAAIDKAKEILASRVTVFMQVKVSEKNGNNDQYISRKTRGALIQHFRQLGNKLHSLAMLNLVSVCSSDPMAQVKGLLTNLIAKLEKEAKEAADLHEFCKAEKEKTSAAIKKKTMTLNELDARIETASTKKTTLEETISDLTEDIAEMEKSQAEATKLRNEENANFVKTVTDFTGAAEAVDDAIDALKEYYGSFVQIKSTNSLSKGAAPPVLGGAKSDSAGGIVSILETMGEEFRKTVKKAKAEERAAQDAFDTMVQENKVSKAAKDAEIKGSQSEIKSLKVSIHDFGGDHKTTSGELASINEYVAKLKPQCGGRTVPYEERKAKMEAEIEGLQKGLAILEAESPAGAFSFLQIH